MSGARIDYAIERRRHESFVGRTALLAHLDRLLVADSIDHWVVVVGGPGMGKSAVLAEWLRRREAASAAVPHHFIRRGEYDWDSPAKLVSSLVAQIERRFPGQRESAADAEMHPAARLAAILSKVSAKRLAARGERLVILIDGLDEYDPPRGASAGDPLAAFLPHALPRGVSFLCASRPRHPYLAMLEARDGELVRFDLDEPAFAADNEATVRGYWERAAPSLGLGARFIDQAVRQAGGNLQHAVTLRKRLAGLPLAQRGVELIPCGLDALLAKSWRRIASDPVAVRGLGVLCAAREPLTLGELATVAGWSDEAARQAFVRAASELLVETRREDQAEYRLQHDAIRAYIASTLGAAVVRDHHAALSQRLATWPTPADPSSRRYALRHALSHRAESEDWSEVWRLAADTGFLEAKCRELGAHEVEVDVLRVAERCRAIGDDAIGRRLDDLARALGRESHWLRVAPEATTAVIWNRLRRSGWSAQDIERELVVPGDAAFLRIRHGATRESPALLRDLVAHTGWVTGCAVTPDGRRVISASDDWSLRVWDLASGRAIGSLDGHRCGVTACAVTPDGRRAVSASRDRTLKVWDLASGRVIATLKGHTRRVTACTVTPDGSRVVSASEDRTLKVWDLASGRVLATLAGHAGGVGACAVTPDGRRVVSASDDHMLRLWDLDGHAMATLEGHDYCVTACAVSPDGKRVISLSADETLKLWDLGSGELLATFECHDDGITACAMTLDGGRVIVASEDRTLRVLDLHRGGALATFAGHASGVTACALTPDGRRVVSASKDHLLKVWALDLGPAAASFEGHADCVNAWAATRDARRVVSASEDRTLKIWDVDSGRVLASLEGHARGVNACAMFPDDSQVVSASDDRTLRVWDIAGARVVATLDVHAGSVCACSVTPDGRRVVSASCDRTLRVWDLDTGRVRAILEGHGHGVHACVVTPDGRRVVSASADRTLKLWDLDTGRLQATLEGHGNGVYGCAITPDGRRVISASEDQTLRVWDLDGGRVLAILEGHTDAVNACAVTPDGRRVVSASADQTLKVWDLDSYACVLTHRGDAAFTSVAATASGVIAGQVAGTLWFLDWPPAWVRRPMLRAANALLPAARSRSRGHIILFLAANPSGTSRLALDEECAAIERELRMTANRDDFDFRSKWAVSIDELMRHLNELQPTVVHFSGHGGGSSDIYLREHPLRSPHRDLGPAIEAGIQLQGAQREPEHVGPRALSQMIRTAAPAVRLVVLNACFSDAAADALRGVVDCVVGMRGAIGDPAARAFSIGFYRALGYRRSVGNAVEQAVAALAAHRLPEEHLPVCCTRSGVSADQLMLPGLDLRRAS